MQLEAQRTTSRNRSRPLDVSRYVTCHLSRAIVLVLAAAVLPQTAIAATYHVAQTPDACDVNPGTEVRPWKTITRAVDMVQPGDTVLIHEDTYREWIAPQTSGTKEAPITFQGLDRDKVVLTGADIITDWQRAEGDKPIYRHTPWTARFPVGTLDGKPVYHHPADEKHKIIGRSEQVIVDGKLLEQVLALGDILWMPRSATSGCGRRARHARAGPGQSSCANRHRRNPARSNLSQAWRCSAVACIGRGGYRSTAPTADEPAPRRARRSNGPGDFNLGLRTRADFPPFPAFAGVAFVSHFHEFSGRRLMN